MYKAILVLLLFSFQGFGQSIERQVFNTTGGNYTGNKVILKSSVGEPLIGKHGNTGLFLSEGYFTGSLDKIISTNGPEQPSLHVKVYPNPASDYLAISCTITDLDKIEIYNQTGCKVYSTNNISGNTKINIGLLPAGLYIINCFNKNSDRKLSTTFVKVTL